MEKITLCVLMTQILSLQLQLKRLSWPKVLKIYQDCSQQNTASILNEASEKAAGNFVGQIPFSSCLWPSGLRRRLCPWASYCSWWCWWLGVKWWSQAPHEFCWDIWVHKRNILWKIHEIDLLNKIPLQLPAMFFIEIINKWNIQCDAYTCYKSILL